MAEFPALPIFTDAFIADTLHLNAAQTGAYFMLLMCAWRTKDCSLPDDDEQLARFARMDKRTWKTNREVILKFWTRNNAGHLIQKRLLDERNFVQSKRDKNVAAGKASAKQRHNNANHKPEDARNFCDKNVQGMQYKNVGDQSYNPLKEHETHSTPVQPEVNVNPTNPNPNPLPVVVKREEVLRVGDEISKIIGWDGDPNCRAEYSRIEVWLSSGWEEERDILPTVRKIHEQRKAKGQGPPNNLKYFEQAIADAHASRISPLPEGKKYERTSKYTADDALQEVLGEIRADSSHSSSMLCNPEHLRENPRAIAYSHAGDD